MAKSTTIPPTQEIWLPVVGYPKYEVSSWGQIRSAETKILRRINITPKGQPIVHITNSSFAKRKTHRVVCLVAEAFLGPKPPGKVIQHNDFDKANNRVNNLRYVTPKQNRRAAVKAGKYAKRYDGTAKKHKMMDEDTFERMKALAAQGLSQVQIGKELGVHNSTVSKQLRGVCKPIRALSDIESAVLDFVRENPGKTAEQIRRAVGATRAVEVIRRLIESGVIISKEKRYGNNTTIYCWLRS